MDAGKLRRRVRGQGGVREAADEKGSGRRGCWGVGRELNLKESDAPVGQDGRVDGSILL